MAKRPENDRRRLIEEQRRKARARERRGTILTIVICSVLAVLIVGGSVWYGIEQKKKPPKTAISELGVAFSEAACGSVAQEEVPSEATGGAKHTKKDGDHVDYDKSPPTSGRHNPTPLGVGTGKHFYSRQENPPPERAVHNLEHGYEVVWYDKKATDAQVDALKQIGENAEGKILIVPWDRADFADDKHIVLTSWGERQQCGDVSGDAIQRFFDKHAGPNGRAPEKNAV